MLTLLAVSEAVKTDIALIAIFGIVFPGLVTGLIVFAVAQAIAEHSENTRRRSGRD